MNLAIEVLNLTKRYRNTNTLAVDNISLTVETGEIFGLLGPNGAGKTTTISILCSLLQGTSGDVIINGMNLKSHSNEIKKIIGVVPQDIALFPNLTAFENLRFFGNMYGLKGAILENRIFELLEIFGLAQKAKQKLKTYSGGMNRRVNLIAGILHTPKILFLDEPTVGIDVQSRTVIMEYLIRLKENGMTIIYSSHHMEEAEKFCSRVAIVDMGKIIIVGTPEDLIKNHNNCETLEDIFIEKTGRSLRD
ncbi:MAG: ABC transporter ATP-binding protein [Bacteroidetes bacterium]|nr:ABC transporter ATP-binding protein [Bacteroidota bacterium]